MRPALVLSIVIKYTLCLQSINKTDNDKMNNHDLDHPIQRAWIINSVIGVCGIILNSLVLVVFIQERDKLVTSVNAMIM